MNFTPDIVARILLVIVAIIWMITYKRQSAILNVKNATGPAQVAALEAYVNREHRDNRILRGICAVIGAFSLAFILYSIFAAA